MSSAMNNGPNPSAPSPASTGQSNAYPNMGQQPPYSSPPSYEEALAGARVSGMAYPPAPVTGPSSPTIGNLNQREAPPQFWSPPYPTSPGFGTNNQQQRFPKEHTLIVYSGTQSHCGNAQPCNCCQHNPSTINAIPRQHQYSQPTVRQYPIVIPVQTPDPSMRRPSPCVRCCGSIFLIVFITFFIYVVLQIVNHH